MSEATVTEKPRLFINEHEMYVLMSVYKVPKMVRDTFRVVFKSAEFRDDFIVAVDASEDNLQAWSNEIGIRKGAVVKRLDKLVEWKMLVHEVVNGNEINGSYVVPSIMYSFQETYTHDHDNDFIVVSEPAPNESADCRFPKFINALSWYEGFSDATRRVFAYSMGHITETRFGDFIVADKEFLENASKSCRLSNEQIMDALNTMSDQMLLTETRNGVFTPNQEKFVIDAPWNSVVSIDAEFRLNRLGWRASFKHIADTHQTE